jgi:hypothetical protein
VWATLPQLVFDGNRTDSDTDTDDDSAAPRPPPPPAEAASALFLDSIGGALRVCSAPTIEGLVISLPSGCPAIPARRVGSWLWFASCRLVRTLCLDVP